MNRLEQAFEDAYKADHRDPMVGEELSHFIRGWNAALERSEHPVGSATEQADNAKAYMLAYNKGWDDHREHVTENAHLAATPVGSAYQQAFDDGREYERKIPAPPAVLISALKAIARTTNDSLARNTANRALAATPSRAPASVQAGTGEPKFSCYLQRDYGKAPCDHDCGKLRCMYPSTPKAAPAAVSDIHAMLHKTLCMHPEPCSECDRIAALSPPPSVGEPPSNCTCHPDDRPQQCQKKFAASECIATDSTKPAGEFPFLEKIDTLIASVNEAHHAKSDGWRDGCFAAADAVYKEIKAALAAAPDNQGAPKPVALTEAEAEAALRGHTCRDTDLLTESGYITVEGYSIVQAIALAIHRKHLAAKPFTPDWAGYQQGLKDDAQAAGQDARDAARYRYLRTRDVTLEAEDGPQYVSYTPSLGDDGSKLDFLVDELMAAGQEDAS